MTPTFSIVMPCFDAARHLPDTLDSLARQTLADWELIAVDDGSADATPAILSRAAERDPRVRLVRRANGGPSRARNLGARLARGRHVHFLDADDLWAPERLAVLAARFDAEPAAAALYTRVAFFERSPERPSTRSGVPRAPLTPERLLGENPVCTMSNLAVRREILVRHGGFDERLRHNEDVEWLVRLAAGGARIVGLEATLASYRASEGGLSADPEAMLAGWRRSVEAASRRVALAPAMLARAEAVQHRYLARRCLRVGRPAREAARFALAGLRASPSAFFDHPRRGALTLAGALAAPLVPRALGRRLFA